MQKHSNNHVEKLHKILLPINFIFSFAEDVISRQSCHSFKVVKISKHLVNILNDQYLAYSLFMCYSI